MKKFNKVAIIGVGGIGGSIGKDLRKARLAKEVIGVGRRRSSLSNARKIGAVDKVTLSLENGVKAADLIILATPVMKIIGLGKKVGRFAKKGAVITDVGSTKRHIVSSLEKALPKDVKFVGSHPMAGSEKSGPLSAASGLFKGRISFITPTRRTDKIALKEVKRLWKALGSRVVEASPEKHDRIVAEISQAVHIVASCLVISGGKALEYASSGFRDTTRVALSDPGLWIDICATNKDEISKSLDATVKTLKRFRSAILTKKTSTLKKMLTQARSLRKSIG